MSQQINLYTPILLAPLRHFSARTMLRALGVLALGLGLISAWLHWQMRQLDHEAQATLQRQQQELRTLQAALDEARRQSDPQALARQLDKALQQQDQLNARLLAQNQGMLPPGQGHADLLAWLARSLPPQAWLTELRLGPQRLELSGATLDTAALHRWLGQLDQLPGSGGQPLFELKVEQASSATSPRSEAPLDPADLALSPSPLPGSELPTGSWAFRVSLNRIPPALAEAAAHHPLLGGPR